MISFEHDRSSDSAVQQSVVLLVLLLSSNLVLRPNRGLVVVGKSLSDDAVFAIRNAMVSSMKTVLWSAMID